MPMPEKASCCEKQEAVKVCVGGSLLVFFPQWFGGGRVGFFS